MSSRFQSSSFFNRQRNTSALVIHDDVHTNLCRCELSLANESRHLVFCNWFVPRPSVHRAGVFFLNHFVSVVSNSNWKLIVFTRRLSIQFNFGKIVLHRIECGIYYAIEYTLNHVESVLRGVTVRSTRQQQKQTQNQGDRSETKQ